MLRLLINTHKNILKKYNNKLNNLMKKTIILSFLIIALAATIMASFGNAKIKSYYSGDVTNYNNQVLVATTNTGSLEIFKLEDDQLTSAVKFRPADPKWDTFYDAIFDQENGRLYVYATSGHYLYKYDATNLDSIILLQQITDTTWDWFGALDKTAGQIVTKGNKFVKIWNSDLQIIDAYRVTNKTNPYNVRFGYNYQYIYDVDNSQLEIFDRYDRQPVRTMDLQYSDNTGNHKIHADAYDHMTYVVDDEGLKKFGLLGGFYNIFEHNSGYGYDVVYSTDGANVYFSNGASVYKVAKNDFNQVAEFSNSQLNIDNSWAMGLNTVQTLEGEKIIVFNNSNILVLNSDLQIITKALATEEDNTPVTTSNMWITTDKNTAVIGELVTVRGGGFAINEELTISLSKHKIQANTDNQGNFSAIIRVPEVRFNSDNTATKDIKVVGQKSGLSYSTSIMIKEINTED